MRGGPCWSTEDPPIGFSAVHRSRRSRLLGLRPRANQGETFMLQHKLPPDTASRWNRAVDVAILAGTTLLASRALTAGGGGSGLAGASLVAALLVAVWLLGARAVRHYDLTRAHGAVADLVLT